MYLSPKIFSAAFSPRRKMELFQSLAVKNDVLVLVAERGQAFSGHTDSVSGILLLDYSASHGLMQKRIIRAPCHNGGTNYSLTQNCTTIVTENNVTSIAFTSQ